MILFSIRREVQNILSYKVRFFKRQQTNFFRHHKRVIFNNNNKYRTNAGLLLLLFAVLFSGACGVFTVKEKQERAKLLAVKDASQEDLVNIVNNFSQLSSIDAKMNFKFEDNSYAEVGIAEKYKTADGEIIVQRPDDIFLRVQIPIVKSDIVQMASNGEKFCVAILNDGGSGKYKKFVCGNNNTDYTALQSEVDKIGNGDAKALKQNVNAFSNLRPQHFTEALLVRPIDRENYSYLQSTINQEEVDFALVKKKSPVGWVLRGYYLLDEFRKNDDGSMSITRRFWFDRVGKIRLARQQIFDAGGEVESDIVYGAEGNLSNTENYQNLPLEIAVTRPKEKYKMVLTYQTPDAVKIGENFDTDIFILKNRWELEEVDLNQKLKELTNSSGGSSTFNAKQQ